MSIKNRAKKSPFKIYPIKNREGQVVSYQVDLKRVEGHRTRRNFATEVEAKTFAEQMGVAKVNEGTKALALPQDVRLDAAKAHDILSPHGVSILDAARYYEKHVLAYKTAPLIKEIVALYIADREQKIRRPRTIKDLKSRLGVFANKFGDKRLSDIGSDDLNKWLGQWEPRNFINHKTKISQLYNFALKRKIKWVDENITNLIVKPSVPETKTEIFTVEQAQSILDHAGQFNLLPYMVLGMLAGLRSEEIRRLDSKDILFDNKIIRIGSEVAKKRFQRYITMQPSCLAYLEPMRQQLEAGGPITDQSESSIAKHRKELFKLAKMTTWPHNGLRHSFGSYHYAMWNDDTLTASQMGNSARIVHNYYKAIVTKDDAEKFWALRPAKQST